MPETPPLFCKLYLQLAPVKEVLQEIQVFLKGRSLAPELATKVLTKLRWGNPPPAPCSYQSKVAKALYSLAEEAGEEPCEQLLVVIMASLNGSDSECWVHLSYVISVSLTGAPQLLSVRCSRRCNKVGLRPWEAGYFLAEYCMCKGRGLIEGRNIVELGCGIGLTSIVVAQQCAPRSITLTDNVPEVIANAEYNVAMACTSGFLPETCEIRVSALDWEQGMESAKCEACTTMLVADCVYDPSFLKPLVKLVKDFLCINNNTCGDRCAIFASTIRNEATFDSFLQLLEVEGLAWEDDTEAAQACQPTPPNKSNHSNA